MRKIALVVLACGKEVTIITNPNESIESCLDRKGLDWVKYLTL
jgi:hypothetical protein